MLCVFCDIELKIIAFNPEQNKKEPGQSKRKLKRYNLKIALPQSFAQTVFGNSLQPAIPLQCFRGAVMAEIIPFT